MSEEVSIVVWCIIVSMSVATVAAGPLSSACLRLRSSRNPRWALLTIELTQETCVSNPGC
jgi:hypothetical protein